MNQQPTEEVDRDVKRADQLAVGDHVLEDSSGVYEPHKVLAAVPCRNGDHTPVIAALLLPPAGAPTHTVHYRVDQMVDLATEDELAEVHDEARRHEVVEGLRDLIGLIRTQRVRFGTFHPTVSMTVAEGEVERLAAAGSLPIDRFGDGTDQQAVWTASTGDEHGLPVQATFWGRPAPEKPADPAEAEQEWLFTFGAGQQHDGRFVRIPGTYDSARSRMNRVFGHAWCDQYSWQRFDDEGLPARMTELPESEWPPHVVDPAGLAEWERELLLNVADDTQAGE